MKSPDFKNQFGISHFYNERKEKIKKVGFDSNGVAVYMETIDKENVIHLRGCILDACYYSNR